MPTTDWNSRSASPVLPPTIVFIGSRDPMFEMTREWTGALKANGAPIEFYGGEGGIHGAASGGQDLCAGLRSEYLAAGNDTSASDDEGAAVVAVRLLRTGETGGGEQRQESSAEHTQI